MAGASEAVNIDLAFDTLVQLEKQSLELSEAHSPASEYLLQCLAHGVGSPDAETTRAISEALAAFKAAGEARRDFASNATVWNAYACDDAVIAALCDKIGAVTSESRAEQSGARVHVFAARAPRARTPLSHRRAASLPSAHRTRPAHPLPPSLPPSLPQPRSRRSCLA